MFVGRRSGTETPEEKGIWRENNAISCPGIVFVLVLTETELAELAYSILASFCLLLCCLTQLGFSLNLEVNTKYAVPARFGI